MSHMTSPCSRSISPSVNKSNSSPLTQNTTFKQSVDVESLEWHQFMTNQNDISSKPEYEWQNKSSISSSMITKTALHCAAPKSVTASNIEWNKFIRGPDDKTITFDSNHSPYFSSTRYFNDEVTNHKDDSESSTIKFSGITMANEFSKATQDYSIDKKNLKEPLRISSKMTMNQDIVKRVHDLELKNARFQIEINFLKNDIKWLMKLLKKKHQIERDN
ncbi:hypothetical protein C1646_662560 [Rhizophagus diaphanus]|nr:hypothetical protein C1646_662560 [Rhizophagus diaphanus] [Rhizophagus sp. MUCL 43196]